ncbi:EB domain-containing protein [Trichonephila clavata]|uniref:EB domain-containing protein n=1 Tax=Trichonephila clavata TaxID=2740835 RepID=A0A8X6LYR3_TRICU|nr:EB domain-containing protein [Trichonephila clavata]
MLPPLASLLATSLLWCLCFGVASPQPPGGHQISPRMVESPQKCGTDNDCGDAELLTCDLELKVCKCRDKYSVLSSTGTCLPAKQLGEDCIEDAQCRLLDKNASCEDNSCVCDSGFYLLHDNNGSLCNPGKSAGSSGENPTVTSGVDRNMIIVLAVLAIMFVGICVALHLFSKQGILVRTIPLEEWLCQRYPLGLKGKTQLLLIRQKQSISKRLTLIKMMDYDVNIIAICPQIL